MHKVIFTALLLLITVACFSKTDSTLYYIDKNGSFITNKDSAFTVRYVLSPSADDEKQFVVHDYYLSGKLKLIVHASNKDGTGFQGYCLEFAENGKKKCDQTYKDGKLFGPCTSYYPNGSLHIAGLVDENNTLLVKQCRDEKGNVLAAEGDGEVIEFDDDYKYIIDRGQVKDGLKEGKWTFFNKDTLKYSIYFIQGTGRGGVGYDEVGKEHPFNYLFEGAYFTGNLPIHHYLKNKARYTPEAKHAKIKGTVHITVTLTKNGKLEKPTVTEGLGYGLDEEAVKALNNTEGKWLPAKRYGIAVDTELKLAVNFGLSTDVPTFKH